LIQARFAISLVTRPPTTRQHGTLIFEFLISHVLDFGRLCKRNLAFMATEQA